MQSRACKRRPRANMSRLLNNDTEVSKPDWAAEVIKALDEKGDATGIVACKMLLHDQRDRFHTAGDFCRHVDGRAGNRGFGELDGGQYDFGDYVFSACGGAAVYRRSMPAAKTSASLDDDFFFLLEDVDLAWRAQLAGYPGVVCAGRSGLSPFVGDWRRHVTASYYDGRNGIWLIAKNMPAALLRRYWRRIAGSARRGCFGRRCASWRGRGSSRSACVGWRRDCWDCAAHLGEAAPKSRRGQAS